MANTFITLTDTPSSYFGNDGKVVFVNQTGTGLTFRDLVLDSLHDTELSGGYTPQSGQVLTYSAGAGKWRPATNDPYSAGNGLGKSGLTLNVVAPAGSGLTANSTGVYISDITGVAGTYGSNTSIPVITVNSKGQITNITEITPVIENATNLLSDHVRSVRGTPGQITVQNGTGVGANAVINLVATGVTSATYGSNTQIPQITVDSYGRITNVDLVDVTVANITLDGSNIDGSTLTTTAYRDIRVTGMSLAQTMLAADQKHDILTIEAGNGIDIYTDAAADQLTFEANTDFITSTVSGSVGLGDLNNVDTTGIRDGQVLVYNANTDGFEPGNASSVYSSETPPTDRDEGTLWYDQTEGRLYIFYSGVWVDAAPAMGGDGGSVVNTDPQPPQLPEDGALWFDQVAGRLYVYNEDYWIDASPTTSFDLRNISTDLIPSANVTYDLGTPVRQWKSLYVSSNTIYMGGVPLKVSGEGSLSVGTTPSAESNVVTESYVTNAINNLIDGAPAGLNTLNELAAAIGDDNSFATTINNRINTKADTASLSAVATSGSYTDLSNRPTALSAFTNDRNFATTTYVNTQIQGITVLQGTTGAQGIQGRAGTNGTNGLQGIQGVQGTKGDIGNRGIQGNTGLQGTVGTDGIDGIDGAQGTRGLQGIQGTIGSTGLQGRAGTNGVQGIQGTTGTQGAKGVLGNTGLQGIQGTTGAQGIQGTQGSRGIQGVQGTNGTQGTYGQQGIQGTSGRSFTIVGSVTTFANLPDPYTGSIGDGYILQDNGNLAIATSVSPSTTVWEDVGDIVGPQGTTGIQGSTGVQGTTGPIGIQGVQGNAGLQGTQGIQGTNGIQGIQGAKGELGNTGLQGTQGTQGTQGDDGLQGIQGTVGIQGIQGSDGTQGIQGRQGTIGPSGIQGIQGIQGRQGIQGQAGANGSQGIQGARGILGNTGLQGSQGVQGIQGISGSNGVQGTQGTSGVQGTTGTGIQGVQGIQGVAGSIAGDITVDNATITNATFTGTVDFSAANVINAISDEQFVALLIKHAGVLPDTVTGGTATSVATSTSEGGNADVTVFTETLDAGNANGTIE